MTARPFVSVIVATCSRIPQAIQCIESVLGNSYQNFEILVVDQDLERRLEHLLTSRFPGENRIKYLFSEVQMLSRARNIGVAAANGDIIAFLDDDAVADEEWLAGYVEVFVHSDPAPGAVAGRLSPVWQCLPPRWMPEEKLYLLGLYDKGPLKMPMPTGDLPIGANFAVAKKAAYEAGRFNEELGFSYSRRTSMLAGEDSLFCREIAKLGYQIYYEPRAHAYHTVAANKVQLKAFLKRNYWEGATTVTILYLSGKISRASCPGIVRHHIRRLAFEPCKLLVRRNLSEPRVPGIRKVVRAACECCFSAGVVSWAYRLWRAGVLP